MLHPTGSLPDRFTAEAVAVVAEAVVVVVAQVVVVVVAALG